MTERVWIPPEIWALAEAEVEHWVVLLDRLRSRGVPLAAAGDLAQPVARAYRNAALTLGAAATSIPLDRVDRDPGGANDAAHYFGGSNAQLVSNGGYYIAPRDGDYLALGQVRVTATATGQAIQSLLTSHGGSTLSVGNVIYSSAAAGQSPAALVGDIVSLAAGQGLDLQAATPSLALAGGVQVNNYLSVKPIG